MMDQNRRDYVKKVNETTDWVKPKISGKPCLGLLTGTGLGESVPAMENQVTFAYDEIPHFPLSTVQSHAGRLMFGMIGATPAIVMQGRFHLYEGYTPHEVTFPIRVMQQLGVTHLILTNAAGGLRPGYMPGDIMMITDHINLTGANPLVGPNEDDWGDRFPDMSRAYDPKLFQITETVAASLNIDIEKGVYVGLRGPSLETPAEIRFLTTIGADAVGFSTVQEVIAAVHGKIAVLGLSTITNAHDPDAPQPADVEEIIAVAQKTAPKLGRLIGAVAGKLSHH